MLFRNPVTFGKSPTIPAWQIMMCPTCAWPAVTINDLPAEEGRRHIRAVCGRGHDWETTWSGKSLTIHRAPVAPGFET